MVIRVKETHCWNVDVVRCSAKSKMPKLSRTTFTMVSMEMKMVWTMTRFIPPVVNNKPLTGESVLSKTSSSAEIEEEKLSCPLKGFGMPFLCMKLSGYG